MPALNACLILHTVLWLSSVPFLFGAGLLQVDLCFETTAQGVDILAACLSHQ